MSGPTAGHVPAETLRPGDVLLLPFGKTATVSTVRPIGPRTVYVRFRTEYGWTQVGRHDELLVRRETPPESTAHPLDTGPLGG